MKVYSAKYIDTYFDYYEFVDFLQKFYCKEIHTPVRQHYSLGDQPKGTMLLMPSWTNQDYMGVKLVTVFPENKDRPSINGLYILMNKKNGEVLAQFDGLSLTCKRTAAVSALAAKLILPKRRKIMLMIGTGNMSIELIRAHHRIHQFTSIYIWGRSFQKAKLKEDQLKKEGYPIVAIHDKEAMVNQADLISVATLSDEPLLFGKNLSEGVYVDMVGSYKPDSREADDAVLENAKIFVDTYTGMEESGDLKIPLDQGLIKREDILADLIQLSKKEYVPDFDDAQKLVFKSVGFAASDLACATYLYLKSKREEPN